MPKADKKYKSVIKENPISSAMPWTCTYFGRQAEIDAYISTTGNWETIATVYSVAGFDAEDTASLIIRAVNGYEKTQNLLRDIISMMDTSVKDITIAERVKHNVESLLYRAE
jgi:hypothetical protein